MEGFLQWVASHLLPSGWKPATISWVSWVVHQTAAFCSRETYKRRLFLVRNVGNGWVAGVAGMILTMTGSRKFPAFSTSKIFIAYSIDPRTYQYTNGSLVIPVIPAPKNTH